MERWNSGLLRWQIRALVVTCNGRLCGLMPTLSVCASFVILNVRAWLILFSKEDLQEFPELAFKDPDVDVAENLAFQAFRRLSTVLPLYLQQSRRRTIPTVILVFQGVDALATRAFGDRTCDLLQPHTPTTPLRPYTLLDLLFVALRLFSEDGLRAIFHFRETDVLEGILRDSLDTPVPTQSWRPRRNRWPPLSSRAYSSAIKAQRLGKESPSSSV